MSTLVVPVGKRGKYTEEFSPRFLCFEPTTRMAYLSDKGANVRNWKHRMRVYAIRMKHDGNNFDLRSPTTFAGDLLNIIIYGVTHHRLTGDAAGRIENAQLPSLMEYAAQPDDNTAGWGKYQEGEFIGRPSTDPVNFVEDSCFFSKERFEWSLRFQHYSLCHDTYMMIRDVLIADGLRVPVHGALPNCTDPRNGLRFATFPLYLQDAFAALLDAVVYCCVHGEMIGCSAQGTLGVCMKHCYVCITDRDVLFMAENGSVSRSLPLSTINTLEYQVDAKRSFLSFLTDGAAPDVLICPCDAFLSGADASPSMVTTMPKSDPKANIEQIESLLQTLINNKPAAAPAAPAAQPAKPAKTAAPLPPGEDGEEYDDDLDILDEKPSAAPAPAPAVGTGRFTSRPVQLPFKQYAETFLDTHGRIFKWQPLPGAKILAATVQSAGQLAASHGVPAPARQEIARREEFQQFYFGNDLIKPKRTGRSTSPDHGKEEHRKSSHSHSPAGKSKEAPKESGTDNPYENPYGTEYEHHIPVRKASKLVDMMKPIPGQYF